MRIQKGFTLIELVVTMVIAAILAAIAIPAYSNYVRKAHRTDAKSTLLDLASLEERFYSTQNSYSANWSDLGYGASTANGASIASPNGYYTIAVPFVNAATPPSPTTPSGAPATYSFTATTTGDQAKDTTCTTYTVNSSGGRTAANSGGTDTTSTCW